MERDFFKQYVQEHKDAFENEALPPNMLSNILDKLKEREQQTVIKSSPGKKLKLGYTWLAAACMLLVVSGIYLLLSKEAVETKKDQNLSAFQPSVTKDVGNVLTNNEDESKQQMVVAPANYAKRTARKATKTIDVNQDIYKGLVDSSSVAARLDAIIKAGALTAINQPLKAQLCTTFNEDNNDNVRLAALEVLAKLAHDPYVNQQLMHGLSKQKDPVVQLELIKIMGNNSNPETTDKLIAMANNPFTVDAVKEQVYYALLNNQ